MTGFRDYYRMYRARGLGRVWHHFKDIWLFDLRHGTDTDTWLPIERYEDAPANVRSAVQYQPSFTSEVRKALAFVARHLGSSLKGYDFFDLGSGKGKVCFIARRFPFKSIQGIEFYRPLFEIAQRNSRKFRDSHVSFHCADVTQFPFPEGPVVFFAYNPFNEAIWRTFLDNIAGRAYIVIYNNPVHPSVYEEAYVWSDDSGSRWENKRTVIFASFPKPPIPGG